VSFDDNVDRRSPALDGADVRPLAPDDAPFISSLGSGNDAHRHFSRLLGGDGADTAMRHDFAGPLISLIP